MYKVLVTGGIGVGKSKVCKLFGELHQIPVFYSDYHAAVVLNTNKEVQESIKDVFGDDIYNVNILDRKALADIVFNNTDKLKILNSIVHPAIRDKFENWCDTQLLMNEEIPYIIEEVAIAIELGIQNDFDFVIVVTAEENVRIERVMKRDGCSEQKVRDRMRNQVSEEERIKYADVVIKNDGVPNIECQVKAIHEKILSKINGN